jgi:uncharacterized membrane protein YjgN (DUF898 family)
MAFRTFGVAGSDGGSPVSIEYIEKPGLGRIALLNFGLTLITLSIYRFWAKTNVRRHIWSCVHINGEPLEYTGRGGELFLGFLIVFAVLILPIFVTALVLQLTLGPQHPALVAFNFAVVLVVFLLWGMALYRARRYQLSRTLWRGIRGALVGSSLSYSLLYFAAILLRSMTLGWSTPAMNLNLQERMTGDMRFGSMPFRFRGRSGPLYGPYAICWVTTAVVWIVVGGLAGLAFYAIFGDTLKDIFSERSNRPPNMDILGLIVVAGVVAAYLLLAIVSALTWAFYVAREMSIFASYTTLDQARFRLDATGGSLILLILGNIVLILFTLGIAMPFAQQRLVRYFCTRLTVHGTVNVNQIMQSREVVGQTGEGLADAFDVSWI